MNLTEDTFYLYAAKYYDNRLCLTQDEFYNDMKLFSSIKRMLSRKYVGANSSTQIMMNSFITLYNVLEHHAASELLECKLDANLFKLANSVLKYLSMPLVSNGEIDKTFYKEINELLK